MTEPNFDRVARLYRWAEYLTLGPLLQRTRTHFLPQLATRRRALILGDGDGRFTSALLRAHPHIHALAVDTSPRMLALLRARTPSPRLETLHASALDVTPPPATDLIVTHFFLDCLTPPQLQTLTQTLATHTAPGALWLVSDFQIPPGPAPLRLAARLYIRTLYLAFRLLTGLRPQQLPPIHQSLTAAGFRPVAQHTNLAGILFTTLYQHP